MKPDAINKDPAFPVMAMDILNNVLNRADNPGDLGTYLTEEVRDLTGARCVLLTQCLCTPSVTAHRIVSVNPLRRREWAESPAGNRLYEILHRVPAAQFWRGEDPSEVAGLLRREGFELSMVFPLNAEGFQVGAMLVLGLPDDEHITSVHSLLNNLSAIVALVLRNSILFEKQEQLIQERTAELRDNNEKLVMELTERKRAEETLHRLNRELRAVSDCNLVLVRAVDEQTLLNDICHIICDEADYRMVWVGYAENDDAKTIRPVAWAGAEDGYLEQARLTWADTEGGQGPAGKSIRNGELFCIQDFTTDPQMALWREGALLRGYRSVITLPLKDESGRAFGVLIVYSAEINAITPDEIRILKELSGNLAFGIIALRARTERKRAVEALRENQAQLDLALQSASMGVWHWDLIENKNYFDDQVCHLLGINPATFTGAAEELLGAVHPDDRETLKAALARSIEQDVLYEPEYRAVWPDGSVHHITARARLVRGNEGRPHRINGIIWDITESKRAEERLAKLNEELEQRVCERTALLQQKTEDLEQANERLKEVDRLKSRFIASMSHELRTPLNAIIGFSSVLLDEWLGPANAEQKQNLASILGSGRHLLNMINDILDVTQIEAGTIKPVIEEFDLYDLLGEAQSQVTATIREKGLELQSESLRQRMRTDRRRLLQCVLNLLSNAAKFTDKGGVTVAARIVPFTGEAPEDEMVEIAVTDTGIGIGAEDLVRIFQPFFRIVIPQRAIVPGTGLGLFLTRKIAMEMLKGDLLVSSECGKGSRFSLKIPVRLP